MSPSLFDKPDEPRSAANAPPLRPTPPLAKRLNRNALTVAAVIMGLTVLTAVVVLSPSSEERTTGAAKEQSTDETPPVPARPTFLDEPARVAPVVASSIGTEQAASERPELSDAVVLRGGNREISSGYADRYALPPTLTSAEPSARERAYLAAVASPVLVGTRESGGNTARSEASATSTDEESQLLSLGDSIMRAAARAASVSTATGPTPVQVPSDIPRPIDRRRTFLDDARDSGGSRVVARLEQPASPYTLHAGSVIPGLLVTGINSDLPGEIVGQVSRNVYDSRTQRLLLVPKGARLIGTHDNQIAAGQGRLLIAWTRLILPDGRSMRLPGLALKDPQGQTGAKDKVDNHWRRVFGNALLLSAISAGVQLSQPQQSSVLAPPSAGQVAAGVIGQELSNVALEILRRGMDVAPTITIRQGQPFNVFLNGDLVFDGTYAEERASSAH